MTALRLGLSMLPLLTLVTALSMAGPSAAVEPASLEGKPAPDISLPATSVPGKSGGEVLNLSDLKGKTVVLYFYPKAMTSGCTVESCGYRDLADQFGQANAVVIGISTDKLDAQKQFIDKEHLNFPLIADADKKAAQAYGVLSSRGYAKRFTFVIDKDGTVRKVYDVKDVKMHPHDVLEYVQGMK
jgi:thioredoxin-dependent peroxiredoxin